MDIAASWPWATAVVTFSVQATSPQKTFVWAGTWDQFLAYPTYRIQCPDRVLSMEAVLLTDSQVHFTSASIVTTACRYSLRFPVSYLASCSKSYLHLPLSMTKICRWVHIVSGISSHCAVLDLPRRYLPSLWRGLLTTLTSSPPTLTEVSAAIIAVFSSSTCQDGLVNLIICDQKRCQPIGPYACMEGIHSTFRHIDEVKPDLALTDPVPRK